MSTGLRVSSFKERFSELFAESEKTNTDLGKDLHVSNQTISAWRLGTRSPKEPTVIAIADHFGVSVEWLLGFDVEKEAPRRARSIVIPDSDMFRKAVSYMSPSDYETVIAAFERAYDKMRKEGINAKSSQTAPCKEG